MRAGRKRKPGRRVNGNGRLSRAYAPQWPWKLMIEKARQSALDPLYLTELGRLYTEEQITDQQVEAYRRFDQLLHAYQRIISGPKRVTSCGLEQGVGGGKDPDPDSPAGQAASERDRITLREVAKVYSVLEKAGPRAKMAVLRMWHRNENTQWVDRRYLLRGLDALCAHWVLTRGVKHGKVKIVG